MQDALEIKDRDSLERWLEDKPVEWAQLIALRAALRVFPLVLEGFNAADDTVRSKIERSTLAVWWCLVISSVACKDPTGETRDTINAANAAKAAVYAADATARAAPYGANAPRAAAYAAAYAATTTTLDTIDAATRAATYAAARADPYSSVADNVWATVSADAQWLERNKKGLEGQPLWLEDVRGDENYRANFPPWARKPFDAFAESELALTSSWGLIVDWYRALLPNDVNARPRGLFDEKIEIQIATQPDDFWSREDPQAVIDDIAKIAGWDVGKQKEPLFTITGNVFDDLNKGRGKTPEPEPEPEPEPAPAPEPEPDPVVSPARAETAYIGDNVDGSVDYLHRSEIAFALAGQLNDVWDAMNPRPGPVIPFDSAWWTGLFKRGPKETLEPGFVVHVDAPWGGGKTTFAQYLTQILNPYRLPELPDWLRDLPLGDAEKWKQSHRRPWHVVQFNAWQHEHVSPPWWVFYETIRKAATDAAVNETNQRWDDPPLDEDEDGKNRTVEPRKEFGYDDHPWMSHLRRLEFWVSETFWRLVTPKVLTSLYVTAATAIALWFLVWSGIFSLDLTNPAKSGISGKDLPGALAALLVVLFGGGATIRTILSSFAQSLTPGTPDAAKNYSMGAGDPLQRMRNHFLRLTKRLNRPIIVIVDDLDRCNAKFVTELVRGMQTILASPRVVYVLLGDRDWIEQAFAEVNKEMKAIDVGAEHSFGGRFVEKAIQLSMVLPAMTGEVREGYVEFLLTGKHRMADPAAEPEMLASIAPEFDLDSVLKNARVIASPVDQGSVDEIDKQVRDALSKTSFKDRESAAQQVFASLKTADSLKQGGIGDQIRRSFGRELDFLAVGDEAAEAETRHLLLALAPALPPNPRQIKRILNTLTLNQQVMTKIYPEYRAGSTEWQQLARWVVMAVEWPMSWFTLTRHPELADVVLAMSANPLDEEKVKTALAEVDGDLSPHQAEALASKLAGTRPVVELLRFADADKGWPDAPLTTDAIKWLAEIMPATSGRMLEVAEKTEAKKPAKEQPTNQANA
jgi:hypothetical protein